MNRALSTKNHIGLVLAALLGAGDALSFTGLPAARQPGYVGPPASILVADVVLGVLTLVAVALAWAGLRRRTALRVAALTRIVSAVTALPAFFVQGVPAVLVALAAVAVVLAVVDLWLLLARVRPAVEAAPAHA